MTPRSIRRAAERQALKQARKEAKLAEKLTGQMTEDSTPAAISDHEPRPATMPSFAERVQAQFDQMQSAAKARLSETRAAINRANAQNSTGPKTPEGRAVSCLNNTKFGLTGTTFTVLPWEDRAAFDQLLSGLREEHQPSTPSEQILVDNMAQHHWLSQRALLLQNMCFDIEEPACQSEARQRQLALYMRYQTMHERAFHKALSTLLKLRAERRKEQIGFESQKQKEAAQEVEQSRRQEAHQAKIRLQNAKAEWQELNTEIKGTIEAVLPGHTRIAFDEVKPFLKSAIQDFITYKAAA